VNVRELNRTLLARQMLLRRTRLPVVRAVERLVALQAQYAPSPYLSLWSRLEDFRKERLTRALERGSVVKAPSIRATLHVTTRSDFPFLHASSIESLRARRLEADLERLRAAIPTRPLAAKELFALAAEVLGTSDRWTIASALRRIPTIRTPPEGSWPHTKPTPVVLWTEPVPLADEAAAHVVRRYLAAYGPATRQDIEQFTFFRLGQIDPALDDMRRLGDGLYDVPRGRIVPAETPAPVRFLPPYDSIILAHRDRSRILPDEYYEAVIRRKNATTLATFTVDGFIAGSWRLEGRKLRIEPFAPLPPPARREVDAEGERLRSFYLDE
jgi:hypothetical protein